MTLNVNEAKKNDRPDYGRLEDGAYAARIVQVIDLGIQVDEWKGQKRERPKVHLTYEFPDETIEIDGEDKPRWYGRDYAVSFGERAALTAVIKATGRDIENLSELIDAPVQVEIGTTESGRAKVAGVTKLMKGVVVGELQNPAAVFDFDDPDMDTFHRLPNFLQENIKNAVNYPGSRVEELLEGGSNNASNNNNNTEVPFDDD